MSTRAVTPEAPAVSEPNSTFLPTDEHYRLTGEKSGEAGHDPRAQREERKTREAAERTTSAVSQEAPAASSLENHETSSSIAAASEAASTTEAKGEVKGPAATKTPATSESRWAKMSRENRELREERDRLKAAQPSKEVTPRETQQATAHTATEESGDTKPTPNDVDPKTGRAKYATFGDYLEARDAWRDAQNLKTFREENAKTQREQQQTESERIIHNENVRRTEQARKDYSDYDELAAVAFDAKDEQGRPVLFYTKGSALEGFFLDSERSHDVFHEIFKDFETHSAIFARDAQGKYLMNPVRQLRELAKIENALPEKGKTSSSTSSTSTSVRTVTQAPRPPHQVSGKGNAHDDPIERAVKEGDSATYQRLQNAKDPRYIAALAASKKG